MSRTLFFTVLFAIALAKPGVVHAQVTKATGIDFFEAKIRPVLVTHCFECHSAKATKVKGGLLLDTKVGMLTGGDSGPAVVPGKPSESLLIKSLRHQDDLKMPPKKNQLPESVVRDFEQWIRMGAPDPRTGKSASKGYKTMTLEEAKSFWVSGNHRSLSPP